MDYLIFLTKGSFAVVKNSVLTANVAVDLQSKMPTIVITAAAAIGNMVTITLLICSIRLNPITKILAILRITNVKLLISGEIIRSTHQEVEEVVTMVEGVVLFILIKASLEVVCRFLSHFLVAMLD